MVFLHGGAYVFGSGSMPEYTGYPLVSVGDVILVTVNYRLGPFGFMTTGEWQRRNKGYILGDRRVHHFLEEFENMFTIISGL